jgi:hypothetical protein
VSIPLNFHRAENPARACDTHRSFEAVACLDCAAPPFYSWRTNAR